MPRLRAATAPPCGRIAPPRGRIVTTSRETDHQPQGTGGPADAGPDLDDLRGRRSGARAGTGVRPPLRLRAVGGERRGAAGRPARDRRAGILHRDQPVRLLPHAATSAAGHEHELADPPRPVGPRGPVRRAAGRRPVRVRLRDDALPGPLRPFGRGLLQGRPQPDRLRGRGGHLHHAPTRDAPPRGGGMRVRAGVPRAEDPRPTHRLGELRAGPLGAADPGAHGRGSGDQRRRVVSLALRPDP